MPSAISQRYVPLPTAHSTFDMADDLTQTGVGTEADLAQAMTWYRAAAEGGDKRAQKRLVSNKAGQTAALDRKLEMEAMKEDHGIKGGKGDSCVIM